MKYLLQLSILLSFFLLTACGYKPVYQLASIFPSHNVTLRIPNIENPTLIASLPQNFRSALTKILAERSIAIVKADPPSQYEIDINIISYRNIPRTTIQDDIILLYTVEITFSATVYENQHATPFWTSGTIVTSHIYQTFSPQLILQDLLDRAANDLANAMQLAF